LVESAALMADTVALPPVGTAEGALYKPLVDTVPTVEFPPAMPLTLQVTAVFVVPLTVAVNCCVWETTTDALTGDNVMDTAGVIVTAA
jgi:hypothetical protein